MFWKTPSIVDWSEIGESLPISEKSSTGANGLQPAMKSDTNTKNFLIEHSLQFAPGRTGGCFNVLPVENRPDIL